MLPSRQLLPEVRGNYILACLKGTLVKRPVFHYVRRAPSGDATSLVHRLDFIDYHVVAIEVFDHDTTALLRLHE